ncbi:HAD family acid phosphatase [Legionella hackeliae]|uniref:Acid phosphatase n=1 Tax=Legionella hackeliae TaxID=449 RepID=A0A0A8UQX1_LEGHA|nr:HAD family acid phosphatase [Legionella hackeliae]KTD10432.1 acid phosphatase [Legionella hackeliae]CEK09931.1 Acid phosphatase [Legionella hackeliae]STX49847.1 acid phosphatase, class B [Legionella hackeliae]
MKGSIKAIAKPLIIASFLSVFSFSSYAEPNNLSLLKKEIQTYHDSGLYEKELAHVINQAENYIIQQAKINARHGHTKKLAIVLDIDETSLSNYNKMAKREFIGDKTLIHQEILAANSPAIEPMLKLYNDAIKNGVQVFFVTGRVMSELNATRKNLLNAGFKNWAGLYMRPDSYNQPSIAPFKTQARASITSQGYTIVASIGDQYSDIEGGYMQKGFKLPNPFYHLP